MNITSKGNLKVLSRLIPFFFSLSFFFLLSKNTFLNQSNQRLWSKSHRKTLLPFFNLSHYLPLFSVP